EGSTQPRDFWAQTDANGNPQNGPSAWGLSQIINRNFVSEGTNFTTFVDGNHAAEYPDPVLSTATCREEFASTQDAAGQPITGFLMFCGNSFVDPNTGVLETNPRMTTFSLFSRDLRERGKTVPGGEFSLNALNAWSIGQLTIPRAVGYSAGLLDYFFRGKLEVRRGPHPETQEPSLRIVNRSPDALAKDGFFSLYQDTDKGVRSLAVEWPKLVEAVPQDNDAAPVYLPIPADLPTNGLTLVYQGKLGSEENAVIGKVLTETRIERIYLDWRTNEWMLQTADKLYALPLKTVAGLRFRPAEVEWGERDNQLVAYTFWSVDTFQALLFELERPLGSAQVPTTGAVTAQGHPVVALRLVQQIPLFETLGALDLGTTVEFTEHLDFTQYRVAFTVNSTCRVQDPPLFTYDTYNCASTFSDESLEPLRTLHDAVTARFPLALPRERFGWSPEWYAWNVQRVWADRNGHLVAAVQLQLAPLPGGESWRRFPLLTPWFGTPVESGYYASVQAKLEAPGASVLAVLDLTAGRLLAKTSEDLIRIEKTQRAVHPSPGFWGCYMDPRGETLYVGGTRDGQRSTWAQPSLPRGGIGSGGLGPPLGAWRFRRMRGNGPRGPRPDRAQSASGWCSGTSTSRPQAQSTATPARRWRKR
ncbi:MAG: hypothetical protein HY766_02505, partial [candidate division NC10 bacterium]|nr:hypothetical protein [candidate division NC10 bacterium]